MVSCYSFVFTVGLMFRMVLQVGTMITMVTTEASQGVVCVVRRHSVNWTGNGCYSVWWTLWMGSCSHLGEQ